jgi:hypothetical protein
VPYEVCATVLVGLLGAGVGHSTVDGLEQMIKDGGLPERHLHEVAMGIRTASGYGVALCR